MREEEVWNRALDHGYAGPRGEGDLALAAVLLLDGMAQNGGLLHAVQGLGPQQLAEAIAGYRWFGLDLLADGIRSVAAEAARIGPNGSLALLEELEDRADRVYWAGPPADEALDQAFRARLAASPEAFVGTG